MGGNKTMEQKKQEIAKDVIVLSGAVVCGDVGLSLIHI